MMNLHSRRLEVVVLAAAMSVPNLISIFLADAAPRGAVFAVENTYDSGAGSLRQAILDANAAPGADTIVFDIPFEEPHVIELASPLPSITDAVTLDGTTQPGTKPGLRRSVSPDLQVADEVLALQIIIDGSGAGPADGLRLDAGNCIVRGLVLRQFDGSGISLAGAGNNLVEGNLISGNGGTGISVLSGSGNRIKGNSLFSNRDGGIDLSADGKNEIDLGDKDVGPNDLQNAPSLESVRRFHCDGTGAGLDESCGADDRGWTTAISGTIESLSNESFSLEFFATPPAESGAPSETTLVAVTNQGKTFLGEARVSTGPEGRAPFTIDLPTLEPIPSGTLITATATDSRGNTSEYSNAVAAPASVISWAAAVNGIWNDPAKWTGGVVPGASDDAQITVDGTYTVDFNASATVNSLTVGGATGTQTFSMSANTLTLNAASTFGPNGVFQMSGGTLTGTGTLTVTSQLDWSGGTMTGAGITNADGGIAISGTNDKRLSASRVLNTAGTTTRTAGGQFYVGTGASITNTGTWDCQSDAPMSNPDGGGAAFNNNGTGIFKKSAGAGTTSVGIPFNNSGSVDVQSGTLSFSGGGTSPGAFTGSAGTTLEFGGGTHDLGVASSVSVSTASFSGGTVNVDGSYAATSGTTVSGATANFDPTGTVSSVGSALTISGGVANFTSGEAIAPTTLSISGGTLGGTDTVTVSGLTTWSGGTMAGAGTTNTNGGMAISGFVGLTSSRVLNTAGTTTWTVGDVSVVGASITNNGTWDCQNDRTMTNPLGTAGPFINAAAATFKKSVGAGTTRLNVPFNNSGSVDVQSGTLSFSGGGTSPGAFTGSAGTTLEFASGTHDLGTISSVSVPTVALIGSTVNFGGSLSGGSLTISGSATANANNLVGAINPTSLVLSSGTLQGPGTVTVSGLTTWSGGTMAGAGTTNTNGGMAISGGVALASSRVLNTAGTTTWTAGDISVVGASITNTGTWDCQNDRTMTNPLGTAGPFINAAAATFKKSVGAGTTRLNVPFTTAGNVQALSGTLAFTNGYPQTAGVTTQNGGVITSPTPLDIQGGVLQGIGTVAAGVSSAGQTGPGLSPGILGISGSYTQASLGSFAVEIGGLTAGTGHDRLDVSNVATLAGALQATLVNGFIPSPGDEFTILTCGSRTGTFATTSLPSLPPGLQWRVDYFATAVKLVVLLVPAGRVPGDLAAESPLTAAKSGSNLTLTWSATCVPGDIDFAVYEGVLGNFTSHVPVLCSTGGATTATFAPAAGDRYYLMAAHNGHEEGSYGHDSTGAERALSFAECHPQHIASCP